jgi:hypothetical protein
LILWGRKGFTVSPLEKTGFLRFFAHFSILRNAGSRGWSGDFSLRDENAPRAKTIKKRGAILSSKGPAFLSSKGPDECLTGIGFADMGCDIRIALYLPLCAGGG